MKDEDLDIPAFLRIPQEERNKAWLNFKPKLPPEKQMPVDPAIAQFLAEKAEQDKLHKAEETQRLNNLAVTKQQQHAKLFNPDYYIHVLVKTNPRMKESKSAERFALIMKFDGKTVAEFLDAEGNATTLYNAVKKRQVSVDKS